jgi:uncharacterized protein (DUF58 family)
MKKGFGTIKNIWKLIVLLLLGAMAFSYAMFQGGFVSWFLFYSFLPFALYSLALSFYPLKKMTVERILAKKEFAAGERLTVKIILQRSFPFPLFYLLIKDCLRESTFPNMKENGKTFVFPWFHRKVEFEYTIGELPRGEHAFFAIELKTGDPLGLVEKQITISLDDKILVYPAYEELMFKSLDTHFDQGMAESKERVQRDTTMAVGIREYQPGDRFSWINWKATAKRNDLMTKEFEQRKTEDIFVVMDCAPHRNFEEIVSFTASIVRAMLKKGAQVGLLSSSLKRSYFGIRGGEVQLQQLFYHLATVTNQCPFPLDKSLVEEPALNHQNGAIMLITPDLTKSLIEKASFLSLKKGAITIFFVKNEHETVSNHEISLKAYANGRGVRVIFAQKGHFADAFMEVSKG